MDGLHHVLLQLPVPEEFSTVQAVGRFLAFAVAAFLVSAAAALLYRWYTRDQIPIGLPTLLSLGLVAIYLNTVGLFGDVLGGQAPPLFRLDAVIYNVLSLAVALAMTPLGRVAGDRLATDVFAVAGVRELDAEVSRIVRSVGRVTPVTLPEATDIEDIEGYDPVAEETKAEMAEKTLLFPRKLTVTELRDRLVTRLKEDYGVGHVDVELDEDGAITYLAVGSRVAGIGPTLGPGTVAVAVRADPPNSASAGDVVQVWRTNPAGRVCTGELRATAGDVVTVAVDEADATKLDGAATYRLVTLPADPQADREFAGLLRAADETMGVVTVAPDSDLVGTAVGSLDVTVAAVHPEGGSVDAIPARSRTLVAGDAIYAVARPEAIRRLEARAESGGSGDAAGESGPAA